jgi:diguanylate cyclase (GGDEF)-like protein
LELNDGMKRDTTALLHNNAIAGIFITLLISTFLAFAFSYPFVDPFKHAWWWVMFCLLLLRFVDAIWWKIKLQKVEYDGQESTMRFVVGVNLTGILLSIYLLYCTTVNDYAELVTSIIAIASLAGGSAAVLNAHKFTAMFYPFILLFPSSISTLFSANDDLQLLGVLGLAFTLMMLIVAKKSADFTNRTLYLKNENSILLHRMEEKVKERTQKIYELSNIDPLTSLYNRTAFLKQLTFMTLISKKPFALLFIDLDGFKKINDSIGHKAGDQLLKKASQKLKQNVSDERLLCRWGGDEFLIIVEETDQKKLIENASRLISILSVPYKIENSFLSIGATIGIALYPEHASNKERLIQFADMAMYHQKNTMRSTVGVFSEEMEKEYFYELHLKAELAKAISRQELRLVFQPIILAKNTQLVAFEALLRWQLDGIDIPPSKFIPIAEQYGLINEIGEWALKVACKEARLWNAEKAIAVSVNISAIQLKDENFISMVKNTLSENALDPALLHIEIKESVFVSDLAILSTQVKLLKDLGVNISIDNFGADHCSLSALYQLAVNTVKINSLYLKDIHKDDRFLSVLVDLATALNFTLIAEGVETEEQEKTLLNLGIECLQGFNYTKPIESKSIQFYINQNQLRHGKN